MTRRLGLLICGHVHPGAVHLGGDYPALFEDVFGPLGWEIVSFDAEHGALPESVDECDAWITSPSRNSVTDEAAWIDGLSEFVVRAVAEERPFAGVCFGHQLLAHALGGRVERAAVGWGVGVKEYEIVTRRPWMEPVSATFSLVASHEDQVVELPPDATLLARADYCPIAAFDLGQRCIALQPHVEFTPAISRALIDLREDLIGADVAATARRTLDRPTDRRVVAGWISAALQS